MVRGVVNSATSRFRSRIPAVLLTGAGPASRRPNDWFDRTGRRIAAIGEADYYTGFMPSPDGKFSALERPDFKTNGADIWLLDMAGGNPSRLTFVNYSAGDPLWSPDSQRVLFTQWSAGSTQINSRRRHRRRAPSGRNQLQLSTGLVAGRPQSPVPKQHAGNFRRSLDPSIIRRPQAPSLFKYLDRRSRRTHFAGWPLARLRSQRVWPPRSLRPIVPRTWQQNPHFGERWQNADMAKGRQRTGLIPNTTSSLCR